MGFDISNILKLFDFLRKRLYFADGLIAIEAVTCSVYHYISKAALPKIASFLETNGYSLSEADVDLIQLAGYLLVIISIYIFWRKVRSPRKTKGSEIGVFFAPNPAPDVENEIERIFTNLHQEIRRSEIGVKFSVSRLPPNLTINSPEEALSLLKKSNSTVIIWGTFESQDSGKRKGFARIAFTHHHKPRPIDRSRINSIIGSMEGGRLHIDERTQITDRSLLAKDIGTFIKNLIGVSLMFENRFLEARNVFADLHASRASYAPSRSQAKKFKDFQMQVQKDLAFCIGEVTSIEYRKWTKKNKIYEIPQSTLKQWVQDLEQAKSIDPSNPAHSHQLAIYYFLGGDVSKSIEFERFAAKTINQKHPIAELGLAFLYCFERDLVRSKRHYKIGLEIAGSNYKSLIIECINFINQVANKHTHTDRNFITQ